VYTKPTYFNMPKEGPLKRFATGGLLGEAGPEAVMPLTRVNGRLGVQASGSTEVIVNNYTGEGVSRRSRRLGDREIIELTIGEMEGRMARGGNSTARAFEGAYNVRRGRR